MLNKLVIKWWKASINKQLPHEIWPPKWDLEELKELQNQRNIDIWIKWLTWPIKKFEDAFKAFLDNKIDYTVSFNSWTSWLLAAYFALWIKDWDEIIWSSLTYHAALSPAFILGWSIILCDIEKNSRCIDPEKMEALITKKTKVITVVHQWWHPANMDKIMSIAKKYNLKVLEDCSHAHWSKYKWQLCWTFWDVSVFSLQANKAIFAWEWGILVTNDEIIYNKATLLWHYRDRSKLEIKDEEYSKFWVTWFWLKLRMSPFNAIVAYHSLNNFHKIKEWRHKCLKYFMERLKEIDYIEMSNFQEDIDMWAWYWFKPLYIKEKLYNITREKLVETLQKEWMEITIPSGWILSSEPLYNLPYNPLFWQEYVKYPNSIDLTPIAQYIDDTSLSLPTFYNWESDREVIDQYIDAFKKVRDNYKEILIAKAI